MTELADILAQLPGGGLMLRMALVAAFVVLVAVVAERLGPFLGGMFASLPLYTGPIYLMLALEHDEAYITAATIGSLAITGATAMFVLGYCIVAARWGTLPSLLAAYFAWGVCAAVVQSAKWSLVEALLFVAPIYAVSVPLARGYTRGVALRRADRQWFDLPLRAVLCGGLAGVVIKLSALLPPQLTGILSVMPILLTSLILVLHGRIGGPATAALLAHSLGGLIGMVIAFALVNQAIPRLGVWPALAIGLATTVLWNIAIITVRHLVARSRAPAMPPPLPHRGQSTIPPPLRPALSGARAAMPPPPPPAWPRRP